MHRNSMQDYEKIEEFMLAGNATFTIQGKEHRFTYKVRKPDDANMHFVSLMTGPDNENSFSYLGFIRDRFFVHGKKSKISKDAISVVAFTWFWSHLKENKDFSPMEFWHEGRCGRCGRKLTVPESIENGIGPECARRMG